MKNSSDTKQSKSLGDGRMNLRTLRVSEQQVMRCTDNPILPTVASLAVDTCWIYLVCCDITDAITNRFTRSCGLPCQTEPLTMFILLGVPLPEVLLSHYNFILISSSDGDASVCPLSGDVNPRLLFPSLCVLLGEAEAKSESHPGLKIRISQQPNAA